MDYVIPGRNCFSAAVEAWAQERPPKLDPCVQQGMASPGYRRTWGDARVQMPPRPRNPQEYLVIGMDFQLKTMESVETNGIHENMK